MNPSLEVPVRWTEYLPGGWPSVGQFFWLAANLVFLLSTGYLFRQYWKRNNETVPIKWVLTAWTAMFVWSFFVLADFYHSVPDKEKAGIMLWCTFFGVLPVLYYSFQVLESFSAHAGDRLGPFSARIEEPSEFSNARRLALRGDIDGAVRLYRNYTDNSAAALFEAARLLRSQGRHDEAAALFEEIARRFVEHRSVWADATYQLAKMKQAVLDDEEGAMRLMMDLIQRAPDSRFGMLAISEINKYRDLLPADEDAAEGLAERPEALPSPQSLRESAARARMQALGHNESEEDDVMPSGDPFYARRMGLGTERKVGFKLDTRRRSMPLSPSARRKAGRDESVSDRAEDAEAKKSAKKKSAAKRNHPKH